MVPRPQVANDEFPGPVQQMLEFPVPLLQPYKSRIAFPRFELKRGSPKLYLMNSRSALIGCLGLNLSLIHI